MKKKNNQKREEIDGESRTLRVDYTRVCTRAADGTFMLRTEYVLYRVYRRYLTGLTVRKYDNSA